MGRHLRHFTAAVGFAALAAVWSFPLVWHLSTHLPGAGIGDNALFVWNFWWMRTALASGRDFFQTSYLFAPVGVDLTLHTHTALPAFLGATVFKSLSVVTAVNVTTLIALFLNGFCAYLLARHLTRDWGASVLAGLIFGTSPYLAAHLNGHFNLTSAWPLPLFALGMPRAIAGSKTWAVCAGVVLAMTAYLDYYYVVFEMTLALCFLALAAWEWSFTFRPSRSRSTAFTIVLAAIVLDMVVLVAVSATGGWSIPVGSVRISMHDTYNPRQLLWVLVGLAAWLRLQPHLGVRLHETWSWARLAPALRTLLGVFLLGVAPLGWKAIALLAHGKYVTQVYYWRSSPSGVDLATLVLGNPFHGLWGDAVQRLYRLGRSIDVIESGAWLGLAPMGLAAYAVIRKRGDAVVRQWAVIGAVFLLWAFGAHLIVFGRDTGLILPNAFLRYIPIVSNARIPGRAMVVVYLALALLSAIAAADWRARHRRPSVLLSLICLAVLADFIAAPFPVAPTACSSIYQTLRDRPEVGAVAELPLGFGDGLMGDLTPMDHQILVCQTIHQHPLVGGVLARLPPAVLTAYEGDPLLAAWLQLSGAHGNNDSNHPLLPGAALAEERLKADGIAFVLLNRATASAALREYVERVLPLTLVAQEDNRALYVVSQ